VVLDNFLVVLRLREKEGETLERERRHDRRTDSSILVSWSSMHMVLTDHRALESCYNKSLLHYVSWFHYLVILRIVTFITFDFIELLTFLVFSVVCNRVQSCAYQWYFCGYHPGHLFSFLISFFFLLFHCGIVLRMPYWQLSFLYFIYFNEIVSNTNLTFVKKTRSGVY